MSPDLFLALAKITALLLVICALAPFLKNPIHRARLWAGTILALPIVFFTSFTKPLFEVIPSLAVTEAKPPSPQSKHADQTQKHDKQDLLDHPELSNNAANPLTIQTDGDLTPSYDPDLLTDPTLQSDLTPVDPAFNQQDFAPSKAHWISLAAIFGTLLALIPLLLSSIKVLRLTKSEALDPPLTIWIKIHKDSRQTPRLFFTPSPAAPFACGVFLPRVILPDDSPTWPRRKLRSTLLHEAEHLRRRDPLVRCLSAFTRAIFWFHPLVWIAHRQLTAAQEQACDQAALHHGIAPEDYAEDLLSSLNHCHLTPSQTLSMAKWSQLGNRVRYVLQQPKPTKMKTVILTASLSLVSLLALSSIGFSQEITSETLPPSTAEKSTRINGRGAILDRNNKPIALDDKNGKRTYPFGKSLAHASGYILKSNPDHPEKTQGVSGLEKTYDALLKRNAEVKVSLDATVQEHCFDLLAGQEFPGAIIVQDPNSGEVIAMASYPSFDPNLFIPTLSREHFDTIQKNIQNPMLDRSVELFYPGSVVKPLVALAGEYKGLNNPEIHCRGFIQIGRVKIRDWKKDRDEPFRIPGALEQSCNTYFMSLAIRAGHDSMSKIGDILHLNAPPLKSITSSAGRWMIPFSEEKQNDRRIALSSLGQGQALLTPLHVSSITSTIASGTWHQPHLLLEEEKTKLSVPLIGQGAIKANSLEVIREGMHLAIHGDRGTAKRAAVPDLQLAGKTGTAQLGSKSGPTHNSWFTGYGPYEAPRYTVTVMLSGADSGSRLAAPIAAKVFKKLLTENL